MHILMGVINLSSNRLYWSKTFCYKKVSSVLPRKGYEILQRYMHVVDKTSYDEFKEDRPYKTRPLLQTVRDEFINASPF